jgi:hypothetical protein
VCIGLALVVVVVAEARKAFLRRREPKEDVPSRRRGLAGSGTRGLM